MARMSLRPLPASIEPLVRNKPMNGTPSARMRTIVRTSFLPRYTSDPIATEASAAPAETTRVAVSRPTEDQAGIGIRSRSFSHSEGGHTGTSQVGENHEP